MNLRLWKLGAAVATVAGLFAAAVATPPADAARDLVVKRFLLGRLESGTQKFIATGARGTTNVYRDNVIMFVFSGPVDLDSLNNRTVKIGIPASGGLFINATGDFYPYKLYRFDPAAGKDGLGEWVVKKEYKNRVLFDPTRRNADPLDRNPYGFAENSSFTVEIPGVDSGTTKTVRGKTGAYLRNTFATTFRTTDRYLQDYTQPTIFKVEGSDAPGIPLANRTNVDSKADVIAFFSEPMLVSAFDPNTTFTVFNHGQNRPVSGTIRPAPDGLSFTFRPVFGYGRGPFPITATLTNALQDRSGNFLDRGIVVNFTSEVDPLAPSFDEEVEDFSTSTFEDKTFTVNIARADWNAQKSPGVLSGVFGTKNIDLIYGGTGGHGIPWWNSTSHTQFIYVSANMGTTPRTISGFQWRYYQARNPLGTTYGGTVIQLGHNQGGNVGTTFAATFSDTPVTVFPSGNYTVNSSEYEWVTGPAFTSNFPYNGKDNLVLDIASSTGGTSVNYWRYTSTSSSITSLRQYTSGSTSYGPQQYSWTHDARFFYQVDNSEARSLWYDTTVNNPRYLDPVVQKTVPPGTAATILFQGGHENISLPGSVDATSLTAWTNDPANDLVGYRFIRFYVDMTSNIGSATKPIIDEIRLPFTYF